MPSPSRSVPTEQLTFFQEPQCQMRPALTFHTNGYPNEKDGSCWWSWKALDSKTRIVDQHSGECGGGFGMTVNIAKFHAVIQALSWIAENMPDTPVTVLCDLNFVVNTVNGKWKAHSSKLLCQTARQYLSRTKATLVWIPHEQNRAA